MSELQAFYDRVNYIENACCFDCNASTCNSCDSGDELTELYATIDYLETM